MTDIEKYLSTLAENEVIAQKFHEVETKILSILNYTDFFEKLLSEIQETFQIPFVWISVIEPSEIAKLIRSLDGSSVLMKSTNFIKKDEFFALVDRKTPILVNENLKPFYKFFPKERTFFIKSMAVAPITFDGKIFGSLNLGDYSADRYHPGMDTTLLSQLVLKVSLCLSNVTAHEKLEFLAFHDPLTELLNRRVMEKILEREVRRAARYQKSLAVVFLDLNYFKKVNDTYGHDQGDHVLKYLAMTLKKMSRTTDCVARFAGDEFVMILPETGAVEADNLLQRIQEHLKAHPMKSEDQEIPVSISFGIASTEEEALTSPELLIKKADERLYEIKHARQMVVATEQEEQEGEEEQEEQVTTSLNHLS